MLVKKTWFSGKVITVSEMGRKTPVPSDSQTPEWQTDSRVPNGSSSTTTSRLHGTISNASVCFKASTLSEVHKRIKANPTKKNVPTGKKKCEELKEGRVLVNQHSSK
jgi:hypothetical protein